MLFLHPSTALLERVLVVSMYVRIYVHVTFSKVFQKSPRLPTVCTYVLIFVLLARALRKSTVTADFVSLTSENS